MQWDIVEKIDQISNEINFSTFFLIFYEILVFSENFLEILMGVDHIKVSPTTNRHQFQYDPICTD